MIEQCREHLEKPFFPGLASYIMSGPCFLMAWEGKDAVAVVRRMIGATNPAEAAPGSIRGDFALDIRTERDPRIRLPRERRPRALVFTSLPMRRSDYSRIDESVLYE